MRSSTTFLAAAAALLSFAAATPLEPRYETCTAPKQWHVCGDGWAGCCTVSPCKGPSIASNCPDEGSSEPPTAASAPSTPSASAEAKPKIDEGWQQYCKADGSNCNWNVTYYHIKNYDDEYASNSSKQLFVWKDNDGSTNLRRDAIGVFKNIPEGVESFTIAFYKADDGVFYGTFRDGSFNMSLIDTGDKEFLDAVDGEVNWKNTAKLREDENKINSTQLDLGNWGWTLGYTSINSGTKFPCKGKKELAILFELIATPDSSVIIDQVNALDEVNNYVTRSGWYIKYE